MASMSIPPFEDLKACVLDNSRPLAARTRAVFYLKQLGTLEARGVIEEALVNKTGTALYRHELAYVLGQMGQEAAIAPLLARLSDTTDDVVVRHECGEALGAIGDMSVLPELERFASDSAVEVAETCQLAVALLKWRAARASEESPEELDESPFSSVDPAPPEAKSKTVAELREQLLDTSKPLFDRYRAMFSLRNRGTSECAKALAEGFSDSSALFRHEVAYVMGQLQHIDTVEALSKVVATTEEHGMVRHEAAEALGSIGTPECIEVITRFKEDPAVIVAESCEVALDIADYWADATTVDSTAA